MNSAYALRIPRRSKLPVIFFSAVAAHAFDVLPCGVASFVMVRSLAPRRSTVCC